MEDYKLIFEAYQKVNEAGFSYAGNYSDSTEQPKPQPRFRKPKNCIKYSTAINTASLPGGTRSVNIAGISSGGGIGENEETADFKKTVSKVPVKEVHVMYNRLMKEIHDLYKRGKYKQMESKLELMAMLSRNM